MELWRSILFGERQLD